MIHNAGETRCKYCWIKTHEPKENDNRYEMRPDKHKTGCPVQALVDKDFNELSWQERKFWPAYKINKYNLFYWNRGRASSFAGEHESRHHYSENFCPGSFRLGWKIGNAEIEDAADAAAESNYSYHRNEY